MPNIHGKIVCGKKKLFLDFDRIFLRVFMVTFSMYLSESLVDPV